VVTATPKLATSSDGLGWAGVEQSPRIWGLDAAGLHLAWWRSQGVQWIPRGEGDVPSRDADLYLLTEPDHLVVFDLEPLVPALTWNCPSVTRLRVVASSEDDYREIVERGPAGTVTRVRREYRSQRFGSRRVLLTADAAVAKLWSVAPNRRSVMLALRANGKWTRSDHHRVGGEFYRVGEPSDEGRLLSNLIRRWPDVDRVIVGVEEIGPGVWGPASSVIRESDVAVGPAWIGHRVDGGSAIRVIGPAWSADATVDEARRASIRDFEEIQAAAPRSRATTESSSTGFDFGKRLFDIAVASIGLVVLSPLMVATAIAVLLDDGWPILFGHERQSRGGRVFRCLKFRTMRRNAERMAMNYADQNICDGPQVFITDDPRVTRLGRVLRRCHIDELPQLINVALGEMSLVGPRPSPERENRMCPAWRDVRLSVRPGITGLWQVSRTRQPGLDFQEWIRFDMKYVSERCWRLDLWILWRTVCEIVSSKPQVGSPGVARDEKEVKA
jgi:lipopolysaccharide/colanic/teichoic acid biosynthesis glycosyltransferase